MCPGAPREHPAWSVCGCRRAAVLGRGLLVTQRRPRLRRQQLAFRGEGGEEPAAGVGSWFVLGARKWLVSASCTFIRSVPWISAYCNERGVPAPPGRG